ncbi:MAG TPA: hypothetical protein VFC41_04785 [Anaerovoracaceae bacterium]|nr:hypothetical protein [Anaerovoracaceae bacterium]
MGIQKELADKQRARQNSIVVKDKAKETEIKDKYLALDKIKKLTIEQRIARIEELMNIK